MLTLDQQKAGINKAVKYLGVLIRHAKDPYVAYILRRSRYRLLTNNGIKARMTYPQADKTIVPLENFKGTFKHIRPVHIVRRGGASLGNKGTIRMVTA